MVLTVVVVAVSFFFTYWVYTERKDLRTELTDLTEELKLIKREGGNMEELEAALEMKTERIGKLANIYSTDRNYINSLDAIRMLGQKNFVDISLLDDQISLLNYMANMQILSGDDPEPIGSAHDRFGALYFFGAL